MNERPTALQIDSWERAEQNAAAWMRYWGYDDARVTQGGADGGVDVVSGSALAQVKFEAHQVGTPALQRLVGARRKDLHKHLLFFSGAGYARPAVEYADTMDIALFKYDLLGVVSPVNRQAMVLSTASAAARPKAEPGRGWWSRNGGILIGICAAIYLGNALWTFSHGGTWPLPALSTAFAVLSMVVFPLESFLRARDRGSKAERGERLGEADASTTTKHLAARPGTRHIRPAPATTSSAPGTLEVAAAGLKRGQTVANRKLLAALGQQLEHDETPLLVFIGQLKIPGKFLGANAVIALTTKYLRLVREDDDPSGSLAIDYRAEPEADFNYEPSVLSDTFNIERPGEEKLEIIGASRNGREVAALIAEQRSEWPQAVPKASEAGAGTCDSGDPVAGTAETTAQESNWVSSN